MRRRAVVVGLCLLLASCASRPPAPRMQSADPVLAAKRTHFDLSRYFLVEKPRCTAIAADSELCDFRLGKNNPGYRELADAIGTRQKISVLCLLPLPSGEQAVGSCTTHRHDGDELKMKFQQDHSWWSRSTPRKPAQELALAELASNRSILELAQYFGQAPDQCTFQDTQKACLWALTASSPGYERSMMATRLSEPFHPPRAKLHVACMVPADGSPRGEKSCQAHISDKPEDVELF